MQFKNSYWKLHFSRLRLVGQEHKRTNNRTMLPTLKTNAAAGYPGTVKIELLKGACLLISVVSARIFKSLAVIHPPQRLTVPIWNCIPQPSKVSPSPSLLKWHGIKVRCAAVQKN